MLKKIRSDHFRCSWRRFLYAVVIRDIASYEVGSLRTLDVLATAVGAMFIWEMLVYFSAYLDLYVLKSHRQKQSTYK